MGTTRDKAIEIYNEMTAQEKQSLRFGIFPYRKVYAAQSEGHDPVTLSVLLSDIAIINHKHDLKSI